MGFTGKEADEEVGLVYFGERYLIPRIGRWASADPLSVHAAGGGESLNGYHYVSGNILQARDPLGLDDHDEGTSNDAEAQTDPSTSPTVVFNRGEHGCTSDMCFEFSEYSESDTVKH